ncbi:eukaryotic translation elongation factor 1 epsilon-1 [Pseudomyrmex gracilis]|uniref:eukaryotic translation elongation factor 1 epsilon-1 n=1 Tax=Pseudomyrmex gracilis TaxID=219809 RepID=UPI000995A9DC|nr:eukaryotic translation elongation factor 1 epsilon-1 [Pseudomyrmex gracilis]
MGLCNIECVEKIARYLDVCPGKLEVSNNKHIVLGPESKDSLPIQGFSTIVQALLRRSKYSDLLGNDKEAQALTQQWLEYITVCINYADLPANAKRVFHELNTVLQDVTYITGTEKTLADIALYYVLHSLMKQLSHQEKAQYIHLSRWFDNVQQEKKLRNELDVVSFELVYLFRS